MNEAFSWDEIPSGKPMCNVAEKSEASSLKIMMKKHREVCIDISWRFTIWLFNIAMENHNF